jgi:hypothetical protein
LRTADAAALDQAMVIGIEDTLMKLSETIATTYLTHIERSEPSVEALA